MGPCCPPASPLLAHRAHLLSRCCAVSLLASGPDPAACDRAMHRSLRLDPLRGLCERPTKQAVRDLLYMNVAWPPPTELRAIGPVPGPHSVAVWSAVCICWHGHPPPRRVGAEGQPFGPCALIAASGSRQRWLRHTRATPALQARCAMVCRSSEYAVPRGGPSGDRVTLCLL